MSSEVKSNVSLSFVVDKFSWHSSDRVCDRYGSFGVESDVTFKLLSDRFERKRVKVVAKVLEVKPCEHIGDLFHGFFHTVPEVGEVATLGIGSLIVCSDGDYHFVRIKPEDSRSEFWLDPMLLYRLCHQRVEITIEETDESDLLYPFWFIDGSKQECPAWIKRLLKKKEGDA